MQCIKGFIGIRVYGKGYLVKIRGFLIGHMYWEGCST
jgi:hypothetical protein